MSIRFAITLAVLAAVVATTLLAGALGIFRIHGTVKKITQDRVNHSLSMFQSLFAARAERVSERVQQAAQSMSLEEPDLASALDHLQRASGLLVLNVCDGDGRPLGVPLRGDPARVPVGDDPVLRRALAGQPAYGVVSLSDARLELEGGPALRNATRITADGEDTSGLPEGALFWWAAVPLHRPDGSVGGVVYGGNTINRDFELVDDLRNLVFPAEAYGGKPLGTVTVFLNDTRVATNVRQSDQSRAVGTRVSPEVRVAVLERGETWNDRAWVVDAWYLSAYAPLRDPDGTPIGMLYVGLLEAPFRDAVVRLETEFALVTVAGALLTVLLVVLLVGRITTPIRYLGEATARMADGELEHRLGYHSSYLEIEQLSDNFRHMQERLHRRDVALQDKNRQLSQSLSDLDRANKNYMNTLGFVTHELRSPLAAMQSIIDIVVRGYLGSVPDEVEAQLVRVKHNCEEMQDMVKNYLDLARAERGELVPRMAPLDLAAAVVHPCIEQNQALLDSRSLRLELECPDSVPMTGDEELLRIALTNYLTNATKYGRKEGLVRVTVVASAVDVTVTVWNEGPGFTHEERDLLFGKFARLRNENTAGKRGSGLGLFLCEQIVALHGGRVWAESVPGEHALFGFAVPAGSSAMHATASGIP